MATYPKLISDKKNPLKASDWFEKANDEVQFAYWVPNVSGGLVITMLPMDTVIPLTWTRTRTISV